MSERNTFSPFWHRVRALKPRLRPHVQITRQGYLGRRWYVVQDPSSNGFYRLNPVAHEMVALLDGSRTVDEVWQLGLTRHGDEALTQNDVITVLSQLYGANLLQADIAPETEQLLSRGNERRKKKFIGQAIGLMYFRIPLFNPNGILAMIEPVMRPLLNKWGFVAWLALVVTAIAALVPHWRTLVGGFDSAIAPSNWPILLASYVVLKLWHETGHGVICKRFGGQVPVFGAMMLVLVPSPYVDASASWSFRSKWQRIAVGGGGMMFELFVAAIAAFVWLGTKDNPGLVHQVAYNVMLTSGVSTVVFNANPLMKFDGYYILSDLIEVPNLMQRSMNMLKFLCQKHLYRVENPQSPTSRPSEALILIAYGIGALIYRVVIFLSITMYIMGKMFALGVFLAVWTTAMWFILPIGQWVHWLATHQSLSHMRSRAIATSVGLVAAGLLLIGVVPRPDYRRATGVVQADMQSRLFSANNGTIKTVHVPNGAHVKQGEAIISLDAPELLTSLGYAKAQLREAKLRQSDALSQSPASEQAAAEYARMLEKQVAYMHELVEKLTIVAPHDGTVVFGEGSRDIGRFVSEGTPLAEVIDERTLRVAAVLPQAEADWIASMPSERYVVEGRRVSAVGDVLELTPTRLPRSASTQVPHGALTFMGGGTIENDPRAQAQQMDNVAKRPIFTAAFTPKLAADATDEDRATALASLGPTGERVKLRFELPSKPLLAQWVDRLEKALQGRAKI